MKFPTVRLRNVIRVIYGKALKQANRDESGKWAVYGSSGAVGKHTETLTDQPTIIIGRKGSVGKITYAANGGWTIDTAFYIEPTNGKTHLRYLYYALRRIGLARHTITTSIPGINRDDIYSTSIPLPPLPEQKRIAAILDKADAIHRKRRQAIQLTEQFLRSTFLDMFGDPSDFKHVKIRNVAARQKHALSSGPFGSSLTSKDYVPEGVLVLRGTNVTSGELSLVNVKYVSEMKARELARSELQPGDVVIVAVGASGHALRIPESLPRAVMSQNFNKITPDQRIVTPTYLEHCINSDFVQRQFMQNITDTVRTFLSLAKIKEVDIPLPQLSIQQEFEQIVERTRISRERLIVTAARSDNLFNSLVQRAFRGEL